MATASLQDVLRGIHFRTCKEITSILEQGRLVSNRHLVVRRKRVGVTRQLAVLRELGGSRVVLGPSISHTGWA